MHTSDIKSHWQDGINTPCHNNLHCDTQIIFADISRANITIFETILEKHYKLVFHTPILSCTIKVRQNVRTNK